MTRLSLQEARRIAIASHGLGARPAPAKQEDVAATLASLAALQIDFVKVLAPAHEMVLFSRLGPYDPAWLHTAVYRERGFTEQWAHEAAIVPVDLWPLFEERRRTHRIRPDFFAEWIDANPRYVRKVLKEVERRGALTAADIDPPPGTDGRLDQAWIGTMSRAVLEAHFGFGRMAVANRESNMARRFDLASRVIPSDAFAARVKKEEAYRRLIAIAARACGVATAADLGDYFRMRPAEASRPIRDLVESGELTEVRVEGWDKPAYLHRDAVDRAPREGATILSPFDPLVWFRPRAERLFGFEYRLEIYTPAPKRRWGYYVLPVLLGDRLAARVDLKADREGGRLLVQSMHVEPHTRAKALRAPLDAELRAVADWLGLGDVVAAR